MKINFEIIKAEYDAALLHCQAVVPLSGWKITPTGVEFTTHKSVFGYATPKGKIEISKAFLETTAYSKLRYTLRHELAHLAAGLDQNHNRVFKRYEHAFGATSFDSEDVIQIENRINYKWTVTAHLENGTDREIGGVHRKTKKYSEYPKDGKLTMSIDGINILRFEYTHNT